MNLTIRTCRAGDALSLAAREPVGANMALAQFARQERGELLLLVALIDEVPLGSVELVFGKVYELRNLQVHERARGRGIGTALVQAAQGHSVGHSELAVTVPVENTIAQQFFERRGFERTAASAPHPPGAEILVKKLI